MTHQVQKRLENARRGQNTYRPNDKIIAELQHTTFVAIIGISSIGKSHLIPRIIAEGGSDFSEVGNMSTRETRPTDHGHFRGNQSIEAMLDRIEQRDLVNYAVHNSGHIYATDLESYRTTFTLLPTLASSLPQIAGLGCFKQIIPIGLITDAKAWEERFVSRHDDPYLSARLEEALSCLAWQKDHAASVPMINNVTGGEAKAAQKILDILHGNVPKLPDADTLSLIDGLIKRVKRQQAHFNAL